jgi:hypothetical protein
MHSPRQSTDRWDLLKKEAGGSKVYCLGLSTVPTCTLLLQSVALVPVPSSRLCGVFESRVRPGAPHALSA